MLLSSYNISVLDGLILM